MANILIVESYFTLGSLYREVLEEEGHRVYVALKGKEAIDLASQQHIDVAVVEEELPDFNSEELIKNLKQLQPHMQGAICTLTESPSKASKNLCDENIVKTPDFTILQEKIKALLRGSSSSIQ